MDRFIEGKYAGMSDVGLDLKSNMDRFIASSSVLSIPRYFI